MKKTIFIAGLFLWLGEQLTAQSYFNQYKDDATLYVKNYAEPLFEANLYNAADGWMHQAKPLKTWAFDLNIMVPYATVPSEKQTFTFDPADYQYLQITDASDNVITNKVDLPTFFGPDSDYKIKILAPNSTPGTYRFSSMDVLKGFKNEIEAVTSLPVGMPGVNIQLNVGLPWHSEVMLRYFPKTTVSGVSTDILGLGLKHEFGHYILPDSTKLHLAVFGVYSHNNIKAVYPGAGSLSAHFAVNSLQLGTGISYDMKLLSLYANAAFIRGTSSFKILGSYNYQYDIVDGGGNIIGSQSETITDPLSLQYGINTYKIMLGADFHVKFFHIFAQYNIQPYAGFHVGLGFKI